MATYGVGTKVKFVRGARPKWEPWVGRVGVVTQVPGDRSFLDLIARWDCIVQFGSEIVNCMFSELEPIVPDSEWASQAVRDLLRKVKGPIPLEGETVMGEK
jgi:hypothetical protein